MHELSIALCLLDVAHEEAARRGISVAAIHVRVGPLSGVIVEALESAFELAREGSRLSDARLVVEVTPLRASCPACRDECDVESPQMLCCTKCGTPTPDIVSGRELEVFALETP